MMGSNDCCQAKNDEIESLNVSDIIKDKGLIKLYEHQTKHSWQPADVEYVSSTNPKVNIIQKQKKKGHHTIIIIELSCIYYGGVNETGELEDKEGICIFNNKVVYRGNVERSSIEGYGEMKFQDGSYYIGEFKKGKPDGYGRQKIGGTIYQGEYSDGKKNGFGILLNQDQGAFQGYFVNNEIFGQGKLMYNEVISEGNWKAGSLFGLGKQTFQDSKLLFQGNFQYGEKKGDGKIYMKNGCIIEGQFKNGQLNGEGYIYTHKRITKGRWQRGQNCYFNDQNQIVQ